MAYDSETVVRYCEEFLPEYRKLQRGENATPHDAVAPEPASSSRKIVFNLNKDDFPEEAISLDGMELLTAAWNEIERALNSPFEDVKDGREAVAVILRRHILTLAESYLLRLALFLACDARFHPEATVQVDAHPVWGENVDDLYRRCLMMIFAADILNAAYPDRPSNAFIANELRLLLLAGGIYFDVCGEVFNLKTVGKCRVAFNLLVLAVGTPSAHERLVNYKRRHGTMYRSIVEWVKNGGFVESKDVVRAVRNCEETFTRMTDEIRDVKREIRDNTRTVANMDRRQRTFLDKLKRTVNSLVSLACPAVRGMTREQAAGKLDIADRYACLARIKEPHRSQLKAVIDSTWEKPVVHEGRSKDDYTLADAARAVWNRNEKKWSNVKGTFDRFEDFKSACYNLRRKSDDPFKYQT